MLQNSQIGFGSVILEYTGGFSVDFQEYNNQPLWALSAQVLSNISKRSFKPYIQARGHSLYAMAMHQTTLKESCLQVRCPTNTLN